MNYYRSVGKDVFERRHGSIEGGAQFTTIEAYLKEKRRGELLEIDAIKVLWGDRFNELFKVTGKHRLITDKVAANKRHKKCLEKGEKYSVHS